MFSDKMLLRDPKFPSRSKNFELVRKPESVWILRVTLSREKRENVVHWRRVSPPPENQALNGTLARKEHTIRQEYTQIRILAARHPARVLHLDLIGETPGNQEEVCIHDRSTCNRQEDYAMRSLRRNTTACTW